MSHAASSTIAASTRTRAASTFIAPNGRSKPRAPRRCVSRFIKIRSRAGANTKPSSDRCSPRSRPPANRHKRWTLLLALIGVCCLGAAGAANAAAKCESREAKCAVAAGGQCDRETGHWCYGYYRGRYCGGSPASFHACLGDRGASHAAAATGGDRCGSEKARCAREVGGRCNSRTGAWCVGGISRTRGINGWCGGTVAAFTSCLDRVRAAGK